MADPRFFTVAGPFSVADIAGRIGAAIAGAGDGSLSLRDVAPLDTATASDLSFLDNRRYVDAFRTTKAGAVIVSAKLAPDAPPTATLLIAEQPYRAYALAAQMFYPAQPPVPGIASTAVIDATAVVGDGSAVGAHAVIGARAAIGKRCDIGANAVIGASVVLGDDVCIGANASLSHCVVGSRVRIYPGARIGQDGFGFAPDPKAPIKVPQLGRVIIGDDVEIGANSTIDRGAGPDTVIGSGTMIDNLVQIAHNVRIGKGCIIVAQVGVSGSTRFDDYVMVGGQAGFAGHLVVGKAAQIGAQAGVLRDVEPGAILLGSPAWPIKEFHYVMTFIRRLALKKKAE
jgi:UDP-3-O-[3-hydroxymyristoyl] glucosamine N-acyltransferase